MATCITTTQRKAAHGQHVCWLCHRRIGAGELYEDGRYAADGTAYSLRAHLACDDAFNSWSEWETDSGYNDFAEVVEGHLPPCELAWSVPAHRGDPCTCPDGAR